MRVTALACFLATALLLFGFVRRFADTLAAFVALGVFLFSPFALLWSRASLIEYLATAAAVGYVWAALEWRERGHASLAVVAVLVGSLAFLVKITTAVVYLIPLLTYVATRDRPGFRGAVRARLAPASSRSSSCRSPPASSGHGTPMRSRRQRADAVAHERCPHDWNSAPSTSELEDWRWLELVRRIGPGSPRRPAHPCCSSGSCSRGDGHCGSAGQLAASPAWPSSSISTSVTTTTRPR